MKSTNELSERELQEKIFGSLEEVERHLKWIANLMTFFFVLTLIGISVTVVVWLVS